MTLSGKMIVQFRKNGQRLTTKTVGATNDFDAVLAAEDILQNLVDNRQIPAALLDYDTVRLNNTRDIPVSGTGRNKGAFGVIAQTRAALVTAQAYLKR